MSCKIVLNGTENSLSVPDLLHNVFQWIWCVTSELIVLMALMRNFVMEFSKLTKSEPLILL